MKIVFALVMFLLVFSVQFAPSSRNRAGLSKAEQFGIELAACQEAWAKKKPDKCRLYGRIRFVDSFPDVTVKVVTSFPDIRVKRVTSFADGPGKWQMVDSFPDYKVKVVTSFEDYKIQYVDSFPGCK